MCTEMDWALEGLKGEKEGLVIQNHVQKVVDMTGTEDMCKSTVCTLAKWKCWFGECEHCGPARWKVEYKHSPEKTVIIEEWRKEVVVKKSGDPREVLRRVYNEYELETAVKKVQDMAKGALFDTISLYCCLQVKLAHLHSMSRPTC